MKKWLLGVVIALGLFMVGCSNNTTKLSQMQIREMTTKEIHADYKTTFKAMMSILQDQDYIIENTDFNSGLIVAEKEANKDTTTGDIIMMLLVDARHKRSGKVRISATITEINKEMVTLRVNIQEKHIIKGTFNSDANSIKNIQDKKVYDTLFKQVATEVERMKARR